MLNKKIIILFFALFIVTSQEGIAWNIDGEISEITNRMNVGGEYEKNIKDIRALKRDHPEDLRLQVLEGIARYGLMDYSGAYGFFESAEQSKDEEEYVKLAQYALKVMNMNKNIIVKMTKAKKALLGKNLSPEGERILKKTLVEGHMHMLNKLLEKKHFYPALVISHIVFLKENNPDIIQLERLSGDIYYSSMLYRQAAESYKKAFEENPTDIALVRVLADSFVASGNFDEAGKYYEKTIALLEGNGSSKNAEEIDDIAKIKNALPKKYKDISELINKKAFDQAEKICRKRISLNSGDYVAITQLGQIYWETKRRWRANKLFKKVIKIAPDYPLIYLYFGRAYFLERKYEKALMYFEKYKEKMDVLPKMDDETVDFYINGLEYISYVYTTMKEYTAAIIECEKIIKLNPDYQRGYFNLAVCYYQIHNRSKTHYYLKRTVNMDPSSKIGERAKFFIDFLRRNPDSRVTSDFSFIYEQ